VKRLILLTYTLVLAFPALAQVPYANDGLLDPTFAAGGKLSIPFDLGGDRADFGWQIAADGSGGYWIIAEVETAASPPGVGPTVTTVALVRVAANGSLITTFGNGGKLETGLNGRAEAAYQDSAGRLLVAINAFDAGGIHRVARFTSTGSLDTSFAGDGHWDSDAGERIGDIAPAAGGGVWVSKKAKAVFTNAELVRLTVAGSATVVLTDRAFPDTTFAGDAPLQVDELGRLWWAPVAAVPGGLLQALVRLTPSGAPDVTYSGDGLAQLQSLEGCGSRAPYNAHLAILPGGTAVIHNDFFDGTDFEASMAVGLPSGAPGPLRCSGNIDFDTDLVARDANTVLAATNNCESGLCTLKLQRYRIAADGTILEDPTFDRESTAAIFPATSGTTPRSEGAQMILDNGKPVIVGHHIRTGSVSPHQTNWDIAVARYGGTAAIFYDGFERN